MTKIGEDRLPGTPRTVPAPDAIVNVIVDVSGEARNDKANKVATAKTLWVPAVNNDGAYGQWVFVEVEDPSDTKYDSKGVARSPGGCDTVKRRKLLARLASGALQNVAFRDLEDLAIGFGFGLARQSGRHRIYRHPAVAELLNLQDVGGMAKPYQIRQMLRLVERYDLRLEDE